MDWLLKTSSVPIGLSTYSIKEEIPNDILDILPTDDDINLYIDIKEETY